MTTDVPRTADFVIIGGGVHGAGPAGTEPPKIGVPTTRARSGALWAGPPWPTVTAWPGWPDDTRNTTVAAAVSAGRPRINSLLRMSAP